MPPTIIAKNNSGSEISIPDLGFSIPNESYRELYPEFDLQDLANSSGLINLVTNGDIVINDGNADLTPSEGLEHISIQSKWSDWIQERNDFYLKTEFINTGMGVSGAGKPIITNSSGYIQSSLIGAGFTAKKVYTWNIHKTSNNANLSLSNGAWWDSYPNTIASGSYSGWPNTSAPIIIPFNCYLKKALIAFKSVNYDWIGATPAPIIITFNFQTQQHNGSTSLNQLTSSFGLFINGTSGIGTHIYTIEGFAEVEGTNSFSEGIPIGVRLGKFSSIPGAINSFVTPICQLQFEEI